MPTLLERRNYLSRTLSLSLRYPLCFNAPRVLHRALHCTGKKDKWKAVVLCVWHWLRSSPFERPHALQIDWISRSETDCRDSSGTDPHVPPHLLPLPPTLKLSFRHPIGTKKKQQENRTKKHAVQSSHCWNCYPATQRTQSFPYMTSHCLFAIIKD